MHYSTPSMAIPLSNLAKTAENDKNQLPTYRTKSPAPPPTTTAAVGNFKSRLLLLALIVIHVVLLALVVQHREKIDDYHQLLNSVLLGTLTSSFGQSIIQLVKGFNSKRLLKFLIWGWFNGVLSSIWLEYLVLNYTDALHRILFDQLVGSPIFQLIFTVFNAVYENASISNAIRTTYLTTLKASYLVWPFCSIISFNFLPLHLIFPFNCLVTLLWSVILSLLT